MEATFTAWDLSTEDMPSFTDIRLPMPVKKVSTVPVDGRHVIRVSGYVLWIALVACSNTIAQTYAPDTSFTRMARAHAIQAFQNGLGQSLPVLQGREWVSNTQKIRGHPFFGSPEPVTGSVRYNGIEYSALSLQYDVSADELLVLPQGDGLRLVIPKLKVSAFTLGQDHFIRPDPEQADYGLTDTGYYRQLYSGASMVLERRWKEIRYQPSEEIHDAYTEHRAYYMMDGRMFRIITGEQGLLSLKGKKNRELKKLLAEKKLRFRKMPEQALIAAGEFYDRIP
jgi:hypothetical protein